MEGTRNNTMASYCGYLLSRGSSSEEIMEAAHRKNATFEPPMEDHDVDKVVNSILRYGGGARVHGAHVSDIVAKELGGRLIRYSTILDVYQVYDGTVWIVDPQERARAAARQAQVARLIADVRNSGLDVEKIDECLKELKPLQKKNAMEGVIRLALRPPRGGGRPALGRAAHDP
jgi:hypothetical protein